MQADAEKPLSDMPFDEKKRRMTEHVKSHFDKICCATDRRTGKEECAAKYCLMHVQRTMTQRVSHVARKMTDEKHPSAQKHFSVATQVGLDIINPDLHHDPACRHSNHSSDAAKMECMGKSIMHHLGKEHGLDSESLQEKLDEMNINIGDSLLSVATTFGWVREGHGPVKSAHFDQKAREEASAATLMRESRRRIEAKQAAKGAKTGRKLEERAGPLGGGGLGKHALHAGSMRMQLQNASGVMHRAMMGVDRAATESNNVQSRSTLTPTARKRVPRPDDLEWHMATSSIPSPLTAILAVSSEERSYVSRFSGGIIRMNELRDRVSHAMATTHRRLQEHEAGLHRRLSANVGHANALYEELERSHAASPPKRKALELPESHALSWVHELVDWDYTIDEGSRLYGIVRNRHKMRETGATHAEIVKKHPTGYQYLDDAHVSSPSILGDALRRVLYRKETGADPPWHESSTLGRVHRRMSERPDRGEGRGNHLRRLGVAFFEATIAAPFAFVDTLMPTGVTVPESEITFWEATLRYIVSSTVGCYFIAPVNTQPDTQGDDGTQDGDRMFVMRPSEEKLCFPAVRTCEPLRTCAPLPPPPPIPHPTPAPVSRAQFPFALPQVPAFREITRTQGVDQYKLNYHDYCHGRGSAMQVTADSLDALGIDVRKDEVLMPSAAILRSAEAVDSILNAASSGSPDVENSMNAGRILCSICQLGGLIYFTLLGLIVLVLINFLPLVNFFFQLLFDGCVACVDAVATKEGRGKLKQNAKAAKANINAARSSAKQAMSQARGAASQARGAGNPRAAFGASCFKESASNSTGGFDASSVHLTAQQLRSLKRARRAQRDELAGLSVGASGNAGGNAGGNATGNASFGQRLRRLGSHIIHLGDASSQEGRSLLQSHGDDGVSPPTSPPTSPPPARAPERAPPPPSPDQRRPLSHDHEWP